MAKKPRTVKEIITVGSVTRRYTDEMEFGPEYYDLVYTAKIKTHVWQKGSASKGFHIVDTRRCYKQVSWWIEREIFIASREDDPSPAKLLGPDKIESKHGPASGLGWNPFVYDPCRPADVVEARNEADAMIGMVQARLDVYRFHPWPELTKTISAARGWKEGAVPQLQEAGEAIVELEFEED